jgi:hypothetical protein
VILYFIETRIFTKRITALGLEEHLRELQDALAKDPLAGDVDAGTGGLRKVRMRDRRRTKGKRSGARVHYLYLQAHSVVYLLFVYGKDERTTLTAREKKELKGVVDRIRSEWAVRP